MATGKLVPRVTRDGARGEVPSGGESPQEVTEVAVMGHSTLVLTGST